MARHTLGMEFRAHIYSSMGVRATGFKIRQSVRLHVSKEPHRSVKFDATA